MKTARFIKDCDGFTGSAKLFELSEFIEYDKPWDETEPPAKKTKYVVVSATYAMFSGDETYIFPADKSGKVLSWGELDGSYRGSKSHKKALENAGFEII